MWRSRTHHRRLPITNVTVSKLPALYWTLKWNIPSVIGFTKHWNQYSRLSQIHVEQRPINFSINLVFFLKLKVFFSWICFRVIPMSTVLSPREQLFSDAQGSFAARGQNPCTVRLTACISSFLSFLEVSGLLVADMTSVLFDSVSTTGPAPLTFFLVKIYPW